MCFSDIIQKLDDSWKEIFSKYKNELELIEKSIKSDKEKFNSLKIFPPRENIFNTFTHLKVSEIKVIILGQDCYHKENQAIGVSFGVPNSLKKPPSLRNIEKELLNDLGKNLSSSDLIYWNTQGVLLLNTSLTVRESCPGSHIKIWKPLIIKVLNDICVINSDIIFILWGNFAKSVYEKVNHNKDLSLSGSHPSPLSANKGGFFGNKYFSKTNNLLEKLGKKSINW